MQAVSPHVRSIHVPAPLRDLPLWLTWAFETRPGDKKPRKMPQYSGGGVRVGQHGSPSDVGRLTTFSVAKDAAARRGLDGVGFAPVAGCGVVALDFDNCVVDGAVDQTVLDLIAGTYSELSPSGNGVRAFFMGDPGVLGNRKSHGLPFGVEAFSTAGFVTVTGNMLDHVDLLGFDNTVAPFPQHVIEYFQKRFGTTDAIPAGDDFMAGYEPRLGLDVEQMEKIVNAIDADCGREDWIKVGMALHHECEGDDTGFELWNDWSSYGTKYPTEEALREQWESFTRRMGPGRKQVTMASAIRLAKDAGLQWPMQPSAATVEARADALVAGVPPEDAPRTPEGFEGKFAIRSPSEVIASKPASWLIKDVVPEGDLIVLYGASGSGKSFVALDLAASIARGAPWRGKKARKGRVVYIAAEGGGGMGKRFKAYTMYHDLQPDTLDVGIMTAAPNFLDSDDITEVIASIRALGDVALVIVDTFAQVTPGANENGAEDMGRALGNAKLIRALTGATVMIVHHAGKDLSRGSRGWSGIKAAADAEIEVYKHEDGRGREIRLGKMKDGDDNLAWGFALSIVTLGLDEDGDEVTSCVALEVELKPTSDEPRDNRGLRRRGKVETHVLEMVATLGEADTFPLPNLIEICVAALPMPEAGQRDTRRQVVVRAIQKLAKEKDGPLAVTGNTVIFYT